MKTHKIEDVKRGLYTVDGSLHPRKDLKIVKGNVIKAPTTSVVWGIPNSYLIRYIINTYLNRHRLGVD